MEPNNEDMLRLNVGGTHFTTTKRTLLGREPDSLFEKLLSAELNLHNQVALRLADGTLFIDRDGFLFGYILEYMRLGRLILPENFQNLARLREEAKFFLLKQLEQEIVCYNVGKYVPSNDNAINSNAETGGYLTLGYRGTFAFGRDGQADVKFRKLHRILVCGKVALCKEVFGDTLNESRDPDREGQERYTSRLYLKHQCLEKACDTLAEKGFKLVATCCSGANGLITTSMSSQATTGAQQEFVNQRSTGDFEEQRWAHYTEYVFYREATFPCATSS